MRNIVLRRLTTTVTNPNYDAEDRDKESERRFKTIEAGEVVKHWTCGEGVHAHSFIEHRRTSLSPQFGALVVAWSQIVPPQSLRQALEVHDLSERAAFEALDRLIESGAVDIAKVVEVCGLIKDEWASEAEAAYPVHGNADRPAPR